MNAFVKPCRKPVGDFLASLRRTSNSSRFYRLFQNGGGGGQLTSPRRDISCECTIDCAEGCSASSGRAESVSSPGEAIEPGGNRFHDVRGRCCCRIDRVQRSGFLGPIWWRRNSHLNEHDCAA